MSEETRNRYRPLNLFVAGMAIDAAVWEASRGNAWRVLVDCIGAALNIWLYVRPLKGPARP